MLTPKPLARTVAIMRGLLARTSDYGPGAASAQGPRYGQVVYLTAPGAGPGPYGDHPAARAPTR